MSSSTSTTAAPPAATTSTSPGPAVGGRVHLLRLNKVEIDRKTGKPKKEQPSWHEARPLAAKAFWLDQLAKASSRLSSRDYAVALELALRHAGQPYGLFKSSKLLAAELGMDDGNLRNVLGRLVKAGLLARGTHKVTTGARPGDERRLWLFVADLNATALAEARSGGAIYAGELVALAPASTTDAAKQQRRLQDLRHRSTQTCASTMNASPVLTVDAGSDKPSCASGSTRESKLSHCETTMSDEVDRQKPASATDAQRESQESLKSPLSDQAKIVSSLTLGDERRCTGEDQLSGESAEPMSAPAAPTGAAPPPHAPASRAPASTAQEDQNYTGERCENHSQQAATLPDDGACGAPANGLVLAAVDQAPSPGAVPAAVADPAAPAPAPARRSTSDLADLADCLAGKPECECSMTLLRLSKLIPFDQAAEVADLLLAKIPPSEMCWRRQIEMSRESFLCAASSARERRSDLI